MRLASRSPSATRSGSRRWPTRARSVVVHLLFNVFAPVGEGPAQRAQAAHATRRASKVGSLHAAERTAETTPSPTALERSWFWGRAASLPACAPCGAPCMLRAVCVSGVEAGALERVEGRLGSRRHGWAPPPARAGGPGVPTREASVERSFKSASLCRVENLYYHSLITILTDTATGRRPLSHGNCQWRSPSYCRAARTTRSQGAGDLGGALEELGAKARDDPSRACAFGRAHRRLARRPASIIEYDLPLPVCPYRRGLCS